MTASSVAVPSSPGPPWLPVHGRIAAGQEGPALVLHPAGCSCSTEWAALDLDPAGVRVRGPGQDEPVAIAVLVLAEHDAGRPARFLQPKQAAEGLRANSLWLAAVHSGPEQPAAAWRRANDVLTRSAGGLADLTAAVPAFAVDSGPQADAYLLAQVGSLLRDGRLHALAEQDQTSIRAAQRRMAEVYGRLESDRAVTWAIEELVELAQAIRRDEGRARLGEELGQLFAWVLCLGNILEIDVASAASTALWREAMRQLSKHGRVWPYVPGEPRS